MIKKSLILFFIIAASNLKAQQKCNYKLDTTKLVQQCIKAKLIIKPKSLKWNEVTPTSIYYPKINFNSELCEIAIESISYGKKTTKGNCKNTNGCTPEIKLLVTLDAITQKIKYKRKLITLISNYE
ncbi:MAG: hypothetical protein JSU07_12070 [Bacteroidetes bacterium]|nr:hypothetical protein [Bacteroidota bacterium]